MASSDFPPPKALPPISIPHSNQTVRVSIIDSGVKISTTRISLLLSPFNKGHDVFTCPAYSFLIEHTPTTPNSKSRKVLFDLNMRKDWHNLAPLVVQGIRGGGFQIEVDKNVSEVLEEEHEDLRNIEAIIWRLVSVAAPGCTQIEGRSVNDFGIEQPLALGPYRKSIHLS